MKQGLKVWIMVYIAYLLINIIYMGLMTTPFRYSWGLKDDYIIILSPISIICADGCSTFNLIVTILISGLIISTILTMMILSLIRNKIKSNL